jgi:hypothetical protein
MMPPWYTLTMLAMECQQVVWLRGLKFAAGGPKAQREAVRCISEKLAAATVATGKMMTGASSAAIVRGYRSTVKANRRRLSK